MNICVSNILIEKMKSKYKAYKGRTMIGVLVGLAYGESTYVMDNIEFGRIKEISEETWAQVTLVDLIKVNNFQSQFTMFISNIHRILATSLHMIGVSITSDMELDNYSKNSLISICSEMIQRKEMVNNPVILYTLLTNSLEIIGYHINGFVRFLLGCLFSEGKASIAYILYSLPLQYCNIY